MPSDMWLGYDKKKVEGRTLVACKFCEKRKWKLYSGTTTNFLNHLKKMHFKELDQAKKRKMGVQTTIDGTHSTAHGSNEATLIISEALPLRFVESKGFKNFIAAVNPHYTIASRRTVSRKVREIREHYMRLWGGKLSDARRFTITVDGWDPDKSYQAKFLGGTAQFLEKGETVTIPLGLHPLKGNSAVSYKDATLALLQKLCPDITEETLSNHVIAIVADGAQVMPALSSSLVVPYVRCAAHAFNLAAQDACGATPFDTVLKKIDDACRAFREDPLKTKLRAAQENNDAGRDPVVPLLWCETRWSSAFNMINRYLYLEQFMRVVEDGPDLLTEEERVVVEGVMPLLFLLRYFTTKSQAPTFTVFQTIDLYVQVLLLCHQAENHELECVRAVAAAVSKRMIWEMFKAFGVKETFLPGHGPAHLESSSMKQMCRNLGDDSRVAGSRPGNWLQDTDLRQARLQGSLVAVATFFNPNVFPVLGLSEIHGGWELQKICQYSAMMELVRLGLARVNQLKQDHELMLVQQRRLLLEKELSEIEETTAPGVPTASPTAQRGTKRKRQSEPAQAVDLFYASRSRSKVRVVVDPTTVSLSPAPAPHSECLYEDLSHDYNTEDARRVVFAHMKRWALNQNPLMMHAPYSKRQDMPVRSLWLKPPDLVQLQLPFFVYVAKELLAIPAAAADSERYFSCASDVMKPKRSRMSLETLTTLSSVRWAINRDHSTRVQRELRALDPCIAANRHWLDWLDQYLLSGEYPVFVSEMDIWSDEFLPLEEFFYGAEAGTAHVGDGEAEGE